MNNIYIYQTSPNQKIVTTKKTKSDEEHTYGICNIEATLTAAKELTDRAFKLYIRMSLHQDGYTYALSPTEINKNIKMSDGRYREAVNELIKKGYLIQSEERKNLYIFYEAPHVDNFQDDTSTNTIDYNVENYTSPEENKGITRERSFDKIEDVQGEILHNSTSQLQLNNTKYNNCNDDVNALFSPEWKEELPF